MSNNKLTELEQRLALAEREVENTRAQVRALQEQERPQSRLRRDGILGLLCLVLVFAVTRVLVTEAQGARPEVLTVGAPFQVVDAGGKVILRVDTGGLTLSDLASSAKVVLKAGLTTAKTPVLSIDTGLTIGDKDSGGVDAGIGVSGNGFLSVRNAAGDMAINLGKFRDGGIGVHLIGPDFEPEASLELVPSSNKAALQVGDPDSGGAHIGIGESGAGYITVLRADGNRGIGLGQSAARPMAVTVFGEKEKELAILGSNEKGGSVRVSNPAGVPIGGLQANATGGEILLMGSNGGTSAVSLGVDGTGGTVNVFRAAGGKAQASLSADGPGGGLTVYDTSGEPVALLRAIKETGRLEISRAGQIYVEAGILPAGVGVVRAGPYIGGMPTGLGLPWAIIGKTGK